MGEKEVEQDLYQVEQVAIETAPQIKRTDTEENLSITSALCKILNELEEIKKAIS